MTSHAYLPPEVLMRANFDTSGIRRQVMGPWCRLPLTTHWWKYSSMSYLLLYRILLNSFNSGTHSKLLHLLVFQLFKVLQKKFTNIFQEFDQVQSLVWRGTTLLVLRKCYTYLVHMSIFNCIGNLYLLCLFRLLWVSNIEWYSQPLWSTTVRRLLIIELLLYRTLVDSFNFGTHSELLHLLVFQLFKVL